MKQYIKDGNIKFQNKIIIRKSGLQIINPKEEQILADGWVEYIIPDPTEEEILRNTKSQIVKDIERYDASSDVNEFTVAEQAVWLDKATRAGFLLRFQAEKAQGVEDTVLWYNGQQFSLKVDQAIQMLYAIELYASACYDNTQRHIANINAMTEEDELQEYDYTVGYPAKLSF